MNAAARLVHHRLLSRHVLLTYLLTRAQVVTLIMAFFVLLSALSVVYVTHTTRLLNAEQEQNLLLRNRLYVERTQLLLERSTLMISSRIERIAEDKLGMIIPDHKLVTVIHE